MRQATLVLLGLLLVGCMSNRYLAPKDADSTLVFLLSSSVGFFANQGHCIYPDSSCEASEGFGLTANLGAVTLQRR
jgi:hypothetical protein